MTSDRSCGSCSLCCKLMGISELDKAPGQWCPKFKRGVGCGIYLDRPTECRTFECEWLREPRWPDEWRPEKSKFVMFTEDDGKRLKIVVDPATPGAWMNEPYYSRFKRMAQKAYEGQRLIICIGQRRIVIFPDVDIDLSVLADSDKIVSGFDESDGRMVPYARAMSEDEAKALIS